MKLRVRVQVVIEPDDDTTHEDRPSKIVHEVATIERAGDLSVETLGLYLAEAKDLLQRVQALLIDEQVRSHLDEQVACPECGQRRRHKDATTHHRAAHAVRHSAFAQSAVVALLLPTSADAHVLPLGRGAAGAD